MTNILKKICNKKKDELDFKKKKCSLKTLKKLISDKKNRNFKKLIQNSHLNKKNNIIAEIKKASPSAGEIIKDYNPENIAVEYEKFGAGAISILTENFFFKGEVDHLSLINLKTNGLKGNLKIKGLLIVYFSGFLIWRKEKNDSLEKTMTSLDIYLDRVNKILRIF